MSRKRLVPSDSILEKWLEEGLSHDEMVDRIYEQDGIVVSKRSVASAISRAGLSKRKRYSEYVPWSPIREDHRASYWLTCLRLAAREAGGEELTEDQRKRLHAFRDRMRGVAVVHYEHDSAEGFYFVQVRKGIDEGLIRLRAIPMGAVPDAAGSNGLLV